MTEPRFDRAFGFLISDVARLLRTEFDRRVEPLGLTRAQCSVLGHLRRTDGLTQIELAELLELEPPSLGRLVDRLEEAGWVKRRPDRTDRRAKRVFLTERATPVLQKIFEVAGPLRREAQAGIGEAEQQQLLDHLSLIKENLLNMRSARRKVPGHEREHLEHAKSR